ncbi:MAG: hypothetical protein RLZ12_759 [Bacillota bacterium]
MQEVIQRRKEKWDQYCKVKGAVSSYHKSHQTEQAKELADGTSGVRLAGRVMLLRKMGKLTFLQLQDATGILQCSLNKQVLGEAEYQLLMDVLDVGDFLGLEGEIFTTQRGEKTLRAATCSLLNKALRPLPEKWHGLADPELKLRLRYLDLLTNSKTRARFNIRHKFINAIRKYLLKEDFLEVETPILQLNAGGASAKPFATHHKALDIPLYLRIAPEIFLKTLLASGYERVFEIGKSFRNEGLDPSHMQEFTSVEYYAAYFDYRDNIKFIYRMLQEVVQATLGCLQVSYGGKILDFSGKWPEVTFHELVQQTTGLDLNIYTSYGTLAKAISNSKKLELDAAQYASYPALVDALYKKYARPTLVQPTFITQQPAALCPLARRETDNPKVLEMFQLVVNGWEVVKAYSELVDPTVQRQLLLEQRKQSEAGDEEAMMYDEDFLQAMEYGLPIMSGLGLGIDRFVALITDTPSIRDVVYFPSIRPKEKKIPSLK